MIGSVRRAIEGAEEDRTHYAENLENHTQKKKSAEISGAEVHSTEISDDSALRRCELVKDSGEANVPTGRTRTCNMEVISF